MTVKDPDLVKKLLRQIDEENFHKFLKDTFLIACRSVCTYINQKRRTGGVRSSMQTDLQLMSNKIARRIQCPLPELVIGDRDQEHYRRGDRFYLCIDKIFSVESEREPLDHYYIYYPSKIYELNYLLDIFIKMIYELVLEENHFSSEELKSYHNIVVNHFRAKNDEFRFDPEENNKILAMLEPEDRERFAAKKKSVAS